MSSDENTDSVGYIIKRKLFWGWYVIKTWFNSKDKHPISNNAFGSVFTAIKISFAIGFFLISIPIGIIILIFALLFIKKRTDIINTNSTENNQ